MRSFAIAALAAVAAAASSEEFEFMNYITKFNKSYQNAEEFAMRFENYLRHDAMIKAHDAAVEGYTVAHNIFSDRSEAEMARRKGHKGASNSTQTRALSSSVESVGASFDWRDSGIITAVQDQGQCGSCWAFSATAAAESTRALCLGVSGSAVQKLSEQQLVDCDTTCDGCDGGW